MGIKYQSYNLIIKMKCLLIHTIWGRRFSLTFTLFITLIINSYSQPDLSLFDYWEYHSDHKQTLYNSLSDIAFEQLGERRAVVSQLKSKEDWEQRQSEVRVKLDQIIGKFPEKTPLNAKVTGLLKGDGFRVEKVIYESQPGLHVTAALFIPDGLEKKSPAILYCSGHTWDGFRSKVYQHAIINYVKKGFVVLAFDPVSQGERLQYLHKKGKKSLYNTPTKEHSYAGGQCFINGQSMAKYMIWDGIRSIDYLVSRVEVDSSRIGVTGRSGGGTQSVYISAFDDRILASAPENYVTSFQYLLESIGPQDAEQNLPNLLKNRLDFADLLEVRAPKPTLIVSTLSDFFSIQGARDTYKEVKQVYRIFGVEDLVQMIEDKGGHESTLKNRERTYAFFQKHLKHPGDSSDLDVTIFSKKDLRVTESGQVLTEFNGESIFSLNKQVAIKNSENKKLLSDSTLTNADSLLKSVIQITGFENIIIDDEYIFSGTDIYEGLSIEKYLIKGNNSRNIPLAVLMPDSIKLNKAVLILNPEGKSKEIKSGLPVYFAKKGYHVIIPDITGSGELAPDDKKGDSYIEHSSYNKWYAGILTGKSIVGLRMEDIDKVCAFVLDQYDIEKDIIYGIARGIFTSDLIHNNVVSRNFTKMALVDPLVSYRLMVHERNYDPILIQSSLSGVLPYYDLPELISTLAPSKLLLINVKDQMGNNLDLSVEHSDMTIIKNAYQQKEAFENLQIRLWSDDNPGIIFSNWLE
jgi:cephalosporin-C deacetylase-like acetyl esterase